MTPIEDNTVLKIGDVLFCQSYWLSGSDLTEHHYVITDIVLGMYVIQNMENVDKRYYMFLHNFIRSSSSSYFLL